MAELIDRQALGIGRCNPDAFPLQNRGYCAGWNGVISLIEQAPTVDAVEVVHGAWEPRKDVIGFVRCSVCRDCNIYDDWADGKKWKYCPNCGAKMDLEVKDV